MKKLFSFSIITLQIFVSGCTKTMSTQGSASLNIVNAISTSSPLITNFNEIGEKGETETPLQYYASANQIPYTGFWESGSYTGSVSLSLSQISDTTITIWNGKLNLPVGSIHTLFLTGDTSTVDTVYTTDIIPYYLTSDSVVGVRFINLSTGSLPMSINIQGNPGTLTDFNNLGYKQITEFKQYNANGMAQAIGSYTFEIRDQATGTLLTTYTWGYTPNKNNTLVIAGSENPASSTPIQVFAVNNF